MVHELTLNLVYVFLLHLITSLIPQIDTPSRPSNFGLPAFLLSSLPSFLPSFLKPPTTHTHTHTHARTHTHTHSSFQKEIPSDGLAYAHTIKS